MNLSKVTEKGQVTLPAGLRRRFGIRQGKSVAFVPTKDGILVKPVEVKDLTGTPRWKKDLNRALADVRAGRVRRFNSDQEYFEHLEKEVSQSKATESRHSRQSQSKKS